MVILVRNQGPISQGRRALQLYRPVYSENLKELGVVRSVQQFFSYYCYLKRPSEMPHNHKLMLFRKGCRPMWEDWKDGGCWIWMSNKKDQQTLLDRKWESLLFACIG